MFHFQDAWFVASYKSIQSTPWFTIHTWRRDFIKEWYRFISSAVSVLPNSNIHVTCNSRRIFSVVGTTSDTRLHCNLFTCTKYNGFEMFLINVMALVGYVHNICRTACFIQYVQQQQLAFHCHICKVAIKQIPSAPLSTLLTVTIKMNRKVVERLFYLFIYSSIQKCISFSLNSFPIFGWMSWLKKVPLFEQQMALVRQYNHMLTTGQLPGQGTKKRLNSPVIPANDIVNLSMSHKGFKSKQTLMFTQGQITKSLVWSGTRLSQRKRCSGFISRNGCSIVSYNWYSIHCISHQPLCLLHKRVIMRAVLVLQLCATSRWQCCVCFPAGVFHNGIQCCVLFFLRTPILTLANNYTSESSDIACVLVRQPVLPWLPVICVLESVHV